MAVGELDNLDSSIEAEIISLQSGVFTIKEHLRACIQPRYRARRLKTKGAILVLVWSFLVTSVYYYIVNTSLMLTSIRNSTTTTYKVGFRAAQVLIGLMLPFAGWFADVYFGRYRVISWSIGTMWISALLVAVSSTVAQMEVLYENIHQYVQTVLLAFLGIGYGGFQANIIQFGVDQLTVASTTELESFANWYVWTCISSGVAANYIPACAPPQYRLIVPLLLCVDLSVVASLLFLCNNLLIKEPVTHNPFKLICGVFKYAIQNKYPRQRSAFTYCEDNLPSRIDYGKSKYGGPFTTEQVEDVKTFCRMFGLLLTTCAVFGLADEKSSLEMYLDRVLIRNQVTNKALHECHLFQSFSAIYYITGTLLIPINEIFIHPFFHQCLLGIKSYYKIFLGVIFHFGKYIVTLVLVTWARQHYIHISEAVTNVTVQCLFHEDADFLNNTLDYRWFAIPEVLAAISDLLILIGSIEFYCAQVPYTMKGLLAGIYYGLLGLSLVLGSGISQLFTMKSTVWRNETVLSCGFWYLLMKIVFLVVTIIMSSLVMKCYKRRKREDVLPNEQIFAERYYSRK